MNAVEMMTRLGIALQLLPVVLFLIVRSRRERQPWEFALDIPLAVAIDLLSVLLLTRLFTLETSILISRPVWVLASVGYFLHAKRQGQWAWSKEFRNKDIVFAVVGALAAVYLSQMISRQCHVADRAWHSGLVPSIRGQSIPFMNVYQPQMRLAYHYSGDALGAMIQVLSFNTLQASNALSWAHDIMFGLTGISTVLLFRSLGFRSATGATLAMLGVLLTGPLTLLRPERVHSGYNFINYLRVSYRPHVSLAGLLFVGFVGTMLVRLGPQANKLSFRRTATMLIVCTAALAITDEASLGMLGLGLGFAWLFQPNVIDDTRWRGLLVLLSLLGVLILANVVFVASLAPGAPPHKLTWIPWRSPGYLNSPISLDIYRGREVLTYDVLPMVALFVGGVLARLRTTERALTTHLTFLGAVFVASFLGLTRIDVDKLPIENHRFMTAPMFAFPLIASIWLPMLRTKLGQGWGSGRGMFIAPFLVVSMALPAASTLEWLRSHGQKDWCTTPRRYESRDDFFKTDCRGEAGARFGDRPVPTYIEKSIYFIYAGCRSTYAHGPAANHWTLRIGFPEFGRPALLDLHENMVKPDEPLPVICPKTGSTDSICQVAQHNGSCKPEGSRLERCSLSGAERIALLDKLNVPAAKPTKPSPASSPNKPDSTPSPANSPNDGKDTTPADIYEEQKQP